MLVHLSHRNNLLKSKIYLKHQALIVTTYAPTKCTDACWQVNQYNEKYEKWFFFKSY